MTAPRATYRLQFRDRMTFARAAGIVPYLAELGVSHLYASPIFSATEGSSHGYDVTDHQALDPALGGAAGFAQLAGALRAHGLGLILDIVPNHMAASTENPWWRDVLMWGAASPYAGHFDIDWTAPKLLLPVLGEPYGEALAEGKLTLALDAAAGALELRYFETVVPVAPPSVAPILKEVPGLEVLAERVAVAGPEEWPDLAAALGAALVSGGAGAGLDAALARVNADPERLHQVHEAQVWRLAHWRLAREALTYRRFFEISELVGVRVEDARVFADVHALPLRLVHEGIVDGLRIDHIDGLADPKTYLADLAEAGPDYVLVEKILGPEEELHSDWATAGTTGYEVARLITALQVDAAGEPAMTAAWTAFTGEDPDFHRQVIRAKRRILAVNLAGELDRLVGLAHAIAQTKLETRDFGRDALRRAVIEMAVAVPVYRSYLDAGPPSAEDRALIERAADTVARDRETEDARLPTFIARLLLHRPPASSEAEAFVRRFQQTTAALTAKSVEDTVFYRFNRLIALNEVGAEPAAFGMAPEAFHRAMAHRAATWPLALSATATHDTKRGEDARARLAVLSEMPRAWAVAVARWHAACADLRRDLPLGPAPGPGAEWLFYQALAGAWPADLALDDEAGLAALAERLDAFMQKALREAKRRTSWTDRNQAFEDAVSGYVRGLFAPARRDLLADIAATLRPVIAAGAVNGLTQLVLKLTLPGVPDIYQGTELNDFSLVDPDNRRPVDFAARRALLEEAGGMTAEDAMLRWRDGLPKLWLMQRLLELRRRRAELFASGSYQRLEVTGPAGDHVFAYARRRGAETVVVAVPRLVLGLVAEDDDRPVLLRGRLAGTRLTLPEKGRWRAVNGAPVPTADDGSLDASDLFMALPAAVLERPG